MKKRDFTLMLLAPIALGVSALSLAEERIGEREFYKNCAVCHGVSGAGDGAIIDFLKQQPADLTQISKNNGGNFPIKRVYDTIVDAGQTRAHGNREMPIWGDRYANALIEEEGEFGMSSPALTRGRVLELVFFLATIQE